MFVSSRRSVLFAVIAALAVLGPGRPATAATAASAWADDDFAAVRLISAVEATGQSAAVSLGLHFRLKKDWKVYWRSAGDAGYPPSLDWATSRNLAAAEISWPVPRRFSILGFETLGYKDEVVLPLEAAVKVKGEPLALRATVDYLACQEICVPLTAVLALDIPAGEARPSAFAHLINRFAVRVPGDGSALGISIERAEVLRQGELTTIRVTAGSAAGFENPDMYFEGAEELVFSKPKVRIEGGGEGAVFEAAVDGAGDLPGGLLGTSVTVTLVNGDRAAERTLKIVAATAAAEADEMSLPAILILAVIGGLILNLMPCVLPVLSIKLLGVVKHGGGERQAVRLNFIATAAGVLFAFMVLAAALVALKEAGAMVGWGIQFQHPWFIIAMTLVVTLFACNLWGFFEIRLPQWIADLGENSSHIHGLGGSFLSGAMASLLATPCSAPFLGTAVAFALSREAADIFAIFAAIGGGLALPYLVVAAAPGLATRLPRPGPWMVKLRLVLGFALAATAVWLLSVLAAQAGALAAGAIGALMVLTAAALYLWRHMPHRFGRAGGAAMAVLAVLAVMAFMVPANLTRGSVGGGGGDLEALWVPFDEAAIPRLVAEGKTVFVDITADWCITCLVNKSLVLSRGEVFKVLTGDNVVAMQADWTLPDADISRYLAGFGRYGIPFDAVYGPAAPGGLTLPELLTQGSVLEAFGRASGGAIAAATSAEIVPEKP